MSGTDQDACIRLVPLARTATGTPRPAVDQDRVFDLAMKGEVLLYVSLPPDRVAFVDPETPIVAIADQGRGMGLIDVQSIMIDYSNRSDLICREVTHVALYRNHAEELRARRRTQGSTFPSGVSPYPDETLALAGWLRPRQFLTSLALCTATEASEGRTCTVLSRLGDIRLQTACIFTIAPEDILVNECVIALLENPQAPIPGDLKRLHDKAKGVYFLYRAAERYYSTLKQDPTSIDDVEVWFGKQLCGLGKT
jgi:hypothetical protein